MADPKAVAERIEQKIDAQTKSYKSRATITAAAGVILLIIIVAYFSVLTKVVQDVFTPEEVANVAMDKVETAIPEVRAQIATELKSNSSEMADQVIGEMLTFIPQIRRSLTEMSKTRLQNILNRVRQDLLEISRMSLDDHQEKVAEMIPYLESDAQAKVFEEEMYNMLMETIDGTTASADLRSYGMTMKDLAARFEYITTSEELTESQRVEREIIYVLKELSNRSN